jgi:hypothetical protein
MRFSAALIVLLAGNAFAFTVVPKVQSQAVRETSCAPLSMGRAAAVRASTKAKTDSKKAKVNAAFGKRIIMAVKEGGSPDPQANRMLNDVIKQAKTNKYVSLMKTA